jgi:superoxide dismutase, Cu-Zn family
MRALRTTAVFVFAGIGLSACGPQETQQTELEPGAPPPATGAEAPGAQAEAALEIELIDRNGERIGTARLSETAEGVSVAIQASALPPGPRGFHFHETGRCDPPSFQTAGAHFAPQGREHGLENPAGPHAGDMPNLQVRPDGTADTTLVNPRVTLQLGRENSLRDADGTALVIHAERDDQRTDPTGESGDRIACGVIPGEGGAGEP